MNRGLLAVGTSVLIPLAACGPRLAGAGPAVEVGTCTVLIQGFEGPEVFRDRPNVSYLSGVPEDAEVEVWDAALYHRRRVPTAKAAVACQVTGEHKTQGTASLKARFARTDQALRVSLRNNISQPSKPTRPAGNSLGFFDCLRGDIYNPSAKPVRCEMVMLGGFAVTDKARTFSLVRLLTLKRGWNTFTVTSAEACATLADRHDATCVEFRTPDSPGATLHFDNFRMERQTVGKNMAKFARCFDFGVEYFTWPGFTYGSVNWDEQRGFGFTAGRSLTHGGDLHVINDQLTRDGFRAPASFRLKLPNGRYKVVTRTGNYWGRRDGDLNLEIKAEGKRVYYRPRMGSREFREFRYAHERTDHGRRNVDLWGTYEDGTYFRDVKFDTEVADGTLDLEFLRPALPAGVRASGDSVWNYLIVYPAERESLIAPELKWLNEKIRTIYNTVSHAEIGRKFALYNREEVICPEEFLYPDLAEARRAALRPNAAEKARGYLHFLRHRHDIITPDSVPMPGETGESVDVFATPGETAAWAVGLYPLKDLEKVTVALGDLRPDKSKGFAIPAASAEVRLVSYRPMTPVTSNHAECFHYIGPAVLIPPEPMDVPKAFPRKFWLSLPIPKTAPAGLYRGKFRFHVAGKPASAVEVVLRVLPFALDEPEGVTFAVAHNSPWSFWGGLEAKDNHELDFFRKLGLTTIWYQGGRDGLAGMRAQAGRYGLKVEQGSPDKYWNARWPENYRHAHVRRLQAQGKGVSFTPRHTGHREGRKIRFTHGFWLWRSGIRHRVIQTQPNACERVYYAHCGHAKFGPCSYRFPSVRQEGLILPAPTLYEVRDGIYDWRYIQTLARTVEKAPSDEPAPALLAAAAYLKELSGAIDPNLDRYYFMRKRNFNHVGRFGLRDTVWKGRRYQMQRWQLARHSAAVKGKPLEGLGGPARPAKSAGVILHAEHFGPLWIDAPQYIDFTARHEGTPLLQAEVPETPVGRNWATVLVKLRYPCKQRFAAVLTDAGGKELARQEAGALKRWKTRWVLNTAGLAAGRYKLRVVPAGGGAGAGGETSTEIEVVPWTP